MFEHKHADPSQHRGDQVTISGGNELLGDMAQMIDARVGDPNKERLEVFGELAQRRMQLAANVGGEQWSPGECARLEIDHTAAAHSGRRRL